MAIGCVLYPAQSTKTIAKFVSKDGSSTVNAPSCQPLNHQKITKKIVTL